MGVILVSDTASLQSLYSNVLEEPGPLGLRLKKSPSLADLIQLQLSKAKSNWTSCATGLESLGGNDNKEPKCSGASSLSSKIKASNFPATLLRIGTWEVRITVTLWWCARDRYAFCTRLFLYSCISKFCSIISFFCLFISWEKKHFTQRYDYLFDLAQMKDIESVMWNFLCSLSERYVILKVHCSYSPFLLLQDASCIITTYLNGE